MLHKFVLDQFKSFGERTEVHLAKITLLYGQNSAGKSSAIQSLRHLLEWGTVRLRMASREDRRGESMPRAWWSRSSSLEMPYEPRRGGPPARPDLGQLREEAWYVVPNLRPRRTQPVVHLQLSLGGAWAHDEHQLL